MYKSCVKSTIYNFAIKINTSHYDRKWATVLINQIIIILINLNIPSETYSDDTRIITRSSKRESKSSSCITTELINLSWISDLPRFEYEIRVSNKLFIICAVNSCKYLLISQFQFHEVNILNIDTNKYSERPFVSLFYCF